LYIYIYIYIETFFEQLNDYSNDFDLTISIATNKWTNEQEFGHIVWRSVRNEEGK